MNESDVAEYHNFLIEHLDAPFSLLINKVNFYTYTFEAQKILATIPQINSMAVVSYSTITRQTTENLINVHRATPWDIKIFWDTEQAFDWLVEKQRTIRS